MSAPECRACGGTNPGGRHVVCEMCSDQIDIIRMRRDLATRPGDYAVTRTADARTSAR